MTIDRLDMEVCNLIDECETNTEQNRDLTININELSELLNRIKYEYDLMRDDLSRHINVLNNNIKNVSLTFESYRHDSECQKLSRDETVRVLEDKLRNLHEDRIAKEKELIDEITDLRRRINEVEYDHSTYVMDADGQKSLLKNNNDVKDLKIRELEANLIDLDKM